MFTPLRGGLGRSRRSGLASPGDSVGSGLEGTPHFAPPGMMMTDRLNRAYGVSFLVAGCAAALWTLVHPWGTIAGPEVGGSTQWAVSHTFHFVAGFFASIGLLGLAQRQSGAGRLERVGYLTAFAGTVMFTGTGIVTAFIWPLLANNAPALVELSGPFFSPPHPVIGITALGFSVGYILFGVALANADVIPKGAAAILVIGALFLLPPPPPLSPVPWLLFPVGGLFVGIGFISIGLAIRSGRVERVAPSGVPHG